MNSKVKIKKNDTVQVITGRDKGKQGKVTQVFPVEAQVVVDGVNIRSKHLKARAGGQAGGRIQYAAPVSVAKVMVVCPHCSKLTRPRQSVVADGRNLRVCHRCAQPLAV